MHPILFDFGPITVYTYGVLLAAAYLLGLKYATVRAKVRGLDQTRVLDLGIYIIIAALIGAKLLLLVTEFDTYTSNPRELLDLARSGGVFYGGLILAVGVAVVSIRRMGLPLWTTCDVFAPGIALGHIVGRLGCLFAGCCYGQPTSLPWGITFTDPFAAANVGTPLNVALHPTQLYEAGAEALILGLLLATEARGRAFPGRTFWLYMLLYAVSRYLIEMFRGDPRGAVGIFSTSQFISVILAPLAIAMLVYLRRRPAPEPRRARKAAKEKRPPLRAAAVLSCPVSPSASPTTARAFASTGFSCRSFPADRDRRCNGSSRRAASRSRGAPPRRTTRSGAATGSRSRSPSWRTRRRSPRRSPCPSSIRIPT